MQDLNLFDDKEPMSRMEFLDHDSALPLWVKIICRLRLALGI